MRNRDSLQTDRVEFWCPKSGMGLAYRPCGKNEIVSVYGVTVINTLQTMKHGVVDRLTVSNQQ